MLTDDQIDRVFRLTLRVNARWADIQIAKLLGGTPDELGSYLWEHWIGAPDEPSEEQVQAAVQFITEHPHLCDDATILGAQAASGL